jgi:hypothetical protein
MYASCLAFYDELPAELRARHEQLCGARALKALCLLSRRPYLACTEQVLRELYSLVFVTGNPAPAVEVINQLLSVPCPTAATGPVRFSVGGRRLTAAPPLPVGPPAGELSLQPLAEALGPQNMAALFVAVLLERRVLLRVRGRGAACSLRCLAGVQWVCLQLVSKQLVVTQGKRWVVSLTNLRRKRTYVLINQSRQYRLLTLVAENVVRLLHPFKFQHVYIPVMPYSLVDYLEAPTPFLMGLHSLDDLDSCTQVRGGNRTASLGRLAAAPHASHHPTHSRAPPSKSPNTNNLPTYLQANPTQTKPKPNPNQQSKPNRRAWSSSTWSATRWRPRGTRCWRAAWATPTWRGWWRGSGGAVAE